MKWPLWASAAGALTISARHTSVDTTNDRFKAFSFSVALDVHLHRGIAAWNRVSSAVLFPVRSQDLRSGTQTASPFPGPTEMSREIGVDPVRTSGASMPGASENRGTPFGLGRSP
jgi:hypothetical protein